MISIADAIYFELFSWANVFNDVYLKHIFKHGALPSPSSTGGHPARGGDGTVVEPAQRKWEDKAQLGKELLGSAMAAEGRFEIPSRSTAAIWAWLRLVSPKLSTKRQVAIIRLASSPQIVRLEECCRHAQVDEEPNPTALPGGAIFEKVPGVDRPPPVLCFANPNSLPATQGQR